MTKVYCSECDRLMGEFPIGDGEVLRMTCAGCITQQAQIEAEEQEVEYYAELLRTDPAERARHREFCRGMNMLIFGDNGPKPKEEGE